MSVVRTWGKAVLLPLALSTLASTSLVAQPMPTGGQCSATRLVGTWERVSLLRNALSVQPPDAPLFVKFGADGYWSMMEMPERPKVDKPLSQQTVKELWSRFERVDGGQGTWTINADGSTVTRHHALNVAPGGENNKQDRLCWFEGEILALVGTGANRSPQARFKRLAAQPIASKALVGTWVRMSAVADGKPLSMPAETLILGEDGWFSATQLPPGRTSVGKPLEQWTVDDYLRSFTGVDASRGTYAIAGSTVTFKHADSIDPATIGVSTETSFSLQGETVTFTGTAPSGTKIEARYQRLKPRVTSP
jgi:hypothetical protein